MKLPKFVIDLVYPLAEFEVYAQRAIARLLEYPVAPLIDAMGNLLLALTGAMDAGYDGSTIVHNCTAQIGSGNGFYIETQTDRQLYNKSGLLVSVERYEGTTPGVSSEEFKWYSDLRKKHGLKRAIRTCLRKELRRG